MTEAPALPESDVIPRVTAADVAFNYDRDGAPPIWPNPKRGAPNVLGVTIRLQPGDQLIAAVQQRMRELSVPDEPEDEEDCGSDDETPLAIAPMSALFMLESDRLPEPALDQRG